MRALICGISGQDGSYLAKFLLRKGYEVIGTSRDAMTKNFSNLEKLNIKSKVQLASMASNDFRNVLEVLGKFYPNEIYNLSDQSSVGLSFEQPVETMESITSGTLNLLEAIRFIGKPMSLYNSGSSECFGDTGNKPADESTAFQPLSPYAVAKSSAHWLTSNYRKAYDLRVCTGILFNHESVLRPERFVTQKIVRAAAKIANGQDVKLNLGNIDIVRDWGWAPDYVEAMWAMLQLDKLEDFVIATGRSVSLKYFIEKSFDFYGLDWNDYVNINPELFRPSDIPTNFANPYAAKQKLNWSHKVDVDGVIHRMCEALVLNDKPPAK